MTCKFDSEKGMHLILKRHETIEQHVIGHKTLYIMARSLTSKFENENLVEMGSPGGV